MYKFGPWSEIFFLRNYATNVDYEHTTFVKGAAICSILISAMFSSEQVELVSEIIIAFAIHWKNYKWLNLTSSEKDTLIRIFNTTTAGAPFTNMV